ncbi:other/AgaK1 protein kinase [Coprinopsis cinerea okayama7|uniref:Other/AgaK1 protein kinase n=1 Tax=Coprinopsis cinerea (strain Okayama-7 / 130 / ATCC MYA-4618 / FGSC 9003) TaxID=240176 RepID=A8NUT3_COPC7|nr:other/AgaK1 protein kinase [Coprinopsis cinerea okayama7\|eukprot:XP_001836529.2 other/AgaK1 protein kinase [Coprinopsis cinerea okayama7\
MQYPRTDLQSWTTKFNGDIKVLQREVPIIHNQWNSLAPFFESHGYYLYESLDKALKFSLAARPRQSFECQEYINEPEYPYARRVIAREEVVPFHDIQSFRVWPAQDKFGREVMIKMIHTSDMPDANELEVHRRLNTPEARADPRNHTLPTLGYIEHEAVVFAVMPRWGPSFVGLRFCTVGQLFHLADVLFEGLVFLHENRIAHRDIACQNTVMNVLYQEFRYHGPDAHLLRNPPEVRYAYIDFGASLIFPMDTDIDTVILERESCMGFDYLGIAGGRANPFKDDVLVLAHTLQNWVRVIEDVVPEIGPYFDNILSDFNDPPSAAVCLERLRELKKRVSDDVLKSAPQAMLWKAGRGMGLQKYTPGQHY